MNNLRKRNGQLVDFIENKLVMKSLMSDHRCEFIGRDSVVCGRVCEENMTHCQMHNNMLFSNNPNLADIRPGYNVNETQSSNDEDGGPDPAFHVRKRRAVELNQSNDSNNVCENIARTHEHKSQERQNPFQTHFYVDKQINASHSDSHSDSDSGMPSTLIKNLLQLDETHPLYMEIFKTVIKKAKSDYYYFKKKDDFYVRSVMEEYKKEVNPMATSIPFGYFHKKTNALFDQMSHEEKKVWMKIN